tara:strand:+ start:48 stop:755 length:708 start_codon:yes stop_codon:yes gene_type:complete
MGNKSRKDYLNDIYSKKSRYLKPKENFLMLTELIKKDKPKYNFSLLDVGCANGELLFNLNKKFKSANLTGIDVDEKLLNKAKINCPKEISFKKKSAMSEKFDNKKFDYIICCGVLSIFKDGEKILLNLKNNLKQGGKIFIFDSFNKYFFNLKIFVEDHRNEKFKSFKKNVYSIQFIERYFRKKKMRIKYHPFHLKTKLKRNKKNFIYNWTEKVAGKKVVTSGLGILQYQYWLKIY